MRNEFYYTDGNEVMAFGVTSENDFAVTECDSPEEAIEVSNRLNLDAWELMISCQESLDNVRRCIEFKELSGLKLMLEDVVEGASYHKDKEDAIRGLVSFYCSDEETIDAETAEKLFAEHENYHKLKSGGYFHYNIGE